MAAGEPIQNSLYVYAPYQWAPILFTALYGISGFFHIFQCIWYKSWRLMWLHCLSGVFLTVGYAMRIYGSYNYKYDPNTELPLMMFILSQIFIYICPPFLELSNYHVLGRVFYYVPHCAPLPPGTVSAIFGGIMLAIELLNSLGVSLAANPSSLKSTQDMGSHLTVAAVAIQIAIILTFLCIAAIFHRRCSKNKVLVRSVNILIFTLYLSMIFILVRCVYRLVEHVGGSTSIDFEDVEAMKKLSPILRYEVYFYVFEASLMFLNSALWNVFNPSRMLPRATNVYIAPDGTEVQGPEEVDTRSLAAKIGHILTFGVLFRRKKGVAYGRVIANVATSPDSSGGLASDVPEFHEERCAASSKNHSDLKNFLANVVTLGFWKVFKPKEKELEVVHMVTAHRQ